MVIEICKERGIEHTEPRQYWASMDGWKMTIKIPNGYTMQLEKTDKD